MKKERKIKRKQRMIGFSLLNRKSKTGWMIGIHLRFGRTGSLYKSEGRRILKCAEFIPDESPYFTKPVLQSMSIKDKISLGYRVYQHIQNNPDFAFIAPAPNALLIVVEALHDANSNYLNNGRALERGILATKEEAFDQVFRVLLSYIEWIAKGSEDVYRSAGLAVKR